MSKLRGLRTAITPRIASEMAHARRRGLSVRQWRSAHSARLDLLPSLTAIRGGLVLDLGANVGDWTDALLKTEPSVRVVAVEPAEAPRARLEERFGDDVRVTINSCAVADKPGSREFHITGHSHNASLQVPRTEMNDHYGPGWDTEEVLQVRVTTVDEIAQGRDVALLKIDVQGAERSVLAGAIETLPRTYAVLLEVTFVSHYENDVGFPWLHDYMTGNGFELAGLSDVFLSPRRTALWCDACYIQSYSV